MMLFKFFAPLLLLFVLAPPVVFAFPKQETNAQRLARGLPPKPPKFGRILPGYSANAFPGLGPRARASVSVTLPERAIQTPVPLITCTGRVDVRTTEGVSLGHVRNGADATSFGVNLTPDTSQDMVVEIQATRRHAVPTNLLIKNSAFKGPIFAGASGSVNEQTIGVGLRNTLHFTNVDKTPPYSSPVPSSNIPGNVVESAIWFINPDTLELTVQYINPNGSKPSTVMAYDIRANSLFFLGDIAAYNTNNDFPASPVKLFLIPGK